ncbi:hypothetical protein ABZ835_08085 [Streptomyces sp. NPDC047461]|uniref:hypothetical protein n=1 Tax=Streptomyces sp. NPDC047461 TaxID=3155619 RepID=UPI0033C8CAFE
MREKGTEQRESRAARFLRLREVPEDGGGDGVEGLALRSLSLVRGVSRRWVGALTPPLRDLLPPTLVHAGPEADLELVACRCEHLGVWSVRRPVGEGEILGIDIVEPGPGEMGGEFEARSQEPGYLA